MIANLVGGAFSCFPRCCKLAMTVARKQADTTQATFIGYVATITVGIRHGIGKKHATVHPDDYSRAVMLEAIGQGICIMGIAASKSSVAVILLRIVVLKWHKVLLWFCVASTSAMCIITTTLLFVQCRPVAFLWDPTIEGGYCWLNFTRVGLTMGGKSVWYVRCPQHFTDSSSSLVCNHGLRSRDPPLAHHHGPKHEA